MSAKPNARKSKCKANPLVSELTPRVNFARRIAAGNASLRLYAILDAESCARRALSITDVAQAWRDAGVCLLQYRDKKSTDDEVLRAADAVAKIFRTADTFLLLNDRTHLVQRAGWDGVHIGQTDGGAAAARAAVGEDAILGLSTHTPVQAETAGREDADYIACGPVFATTSKADAEPVIGLCGLQAVRALVRKPLVAIGGISWDTAPSVWEAGADSVAVISGLLVGQPGVAAARFLRGLREAGAA